MISSCRECTTKCCRVGPGPYKKVPVNHWLLWKDYGSKRYNTACENFNVEDETCMVWDTALPLACSIYICSVRTYMDEELLEIDGLVEIAGLGHETKIDLDK